MTKRSWLVAVCVVILLVGLSAPAASAQSGPVALQGKLDGVGDGERDFTLTIWNAATGGQAVATAEGTALVRSGLFTLLVNLPASAFDGASRWWSVAVDGARTDVRRLRILGGSDQAEPFPTLLGRSSREFRQSVFWDSCVSCNTVHKRGG